jgi:hypothetical protein
VLVASCIAVIISVIDRGRSVRVTYRQVRL